MTGMPGSCYRFVVVMAPADQAGRWPRPKTRPRRFSSVPTNDLIEWKTAPNSERGSLALPTTSPGEKRRSFGSSPQARGRSHDISSLLTTTASWRQRKPTPCATNNSRDSKSRSMRSRRRGTLGSTHSLSRTRSGWNLRQKFSGFQKAATTSCSLVLVPGSPIFLAPMKGMPHDDK